MGPGSLMSDEEKEEDKGEHSMMLIRVSNSAQKSHLYHDIKQKVSNYKNYKGLPYYNIPVKYLLTAGIGSSMPWCAKVHYRTHTCTTHFGKTAGIPVPVLNPIQHTLLSEIICVR